MAVRGKTDFFRAQKFTQSLRALLESLPSESEKQQIATELDLVIKFLTQVKESVGSLPSQESTGVLGSAIDRLDALFSRARASAPLAAALGLRRADHRAKSLPLTEADTERAKVLLERLEKLPIDELRASLEKTSETAPRDLQAIAALMGIRSTQRSSREALAHQIATKIANAQGYEALRRGTEGRE
jgi:hypothetical protein